MFAGVLLLKAAALIFPNHGRNLRVKKWKTKKKQNWKHPEGSQKSEPRKSKKPRRRLNHRDDSHILAASKSNLQLTNPICAQRAGSSAASVILEHQGWSRPRQPHATSCYKLS